MATIKYANGESWKTKTSDLLRDIQSVRNNEALFKLNRKNKICTYLLSSSMLKKTYSPLSTILSSWAASMISLIFTGVAQRTTTANTNKKRIGKRYWHLRIELRVMNSSNCANRCEKCALSVILSSFTVIARKP